MTKKKISLFVGDSDESLSLAAKQQDPHAFLIDHSNYKKFLTQEHHSSLTVYTSLADLPKNLEVFYNIAMMADEIVYAPPEVWSDCRRIDTLCPGDSIQGLTENLLLQVSDYRPVKNLELCYFAPDTVSLVDQRKSNDSQLWVVGCSITNGLGVNLDQRYGQLLADETKKPCGFLSANGASIIWAADQITRSDIRTGDIVVWGITSTDRKYIVDSAEKLVHVTHTKTGLEDQYNVIKSLFDHSTFYYNLYAIERVINFCKKVNATLILLGLLTSDNLFRYLKNKKNYFHFPHQFDFSNHQKNIKFVDLGNDNIHPGPLQHILYKDFVLNIFKKTDSV
jgi:hypothetical protein